MKDKKYLVIPDQHAHPEYHNERANWIGELIKETRPDVVVNMGDAADMSSLCSYDKGKKDFQGRTYRKDIDSHLDFQDRIWSTVRKSKKKLPRRIFLHGNHENRIAKTIQIQPELENTISFDDLVSAYAEQVRGLIDGGADLLLVETVFDTLNAKAALFATLEVFDEKGKELPIMVSGTITDASGRTLSGQTAEAFLISLSHVPLLSIGLNCALGANQLRPYIEILSKHSKVFTSAYPNAGLPNEFGEYDQGPQAMAKEVESYVNDGLVNILGGCCGTTPEHIKAMVELVEGKRPRSISKKEIAL